MRTLTEMASGVRGKLVRSTRLVHMLSIAALFLVATLGMNFMLRGLILIITNSKSIAVPELRDSLAFKITSTQIWGIPLQIVWAIAFVVFCALLYNRHRFGAQVHVVGDNPDSANEMGINVKLVRVKVFAFMGFGAALAGADEVVLTDIYSAGEDAIPGITVDALAEAVRTGGQPKVRVIRSLSDVPGHIAATAQSGDLVVMLGAGSIGAWGSKVLAALGEDVRRRQ